MAIGYVRLNSTKRSIGRNAVQLSAYIARSCLHFEGNCALDPKTYDYSKKKDLIYSRIALPEGASKKFKDPEYLWNMAEKAEKRKDAQINLNFVFALPDDKEVADEDRKHIIDSFVDKFFTSRGLVSQIAIHKEEDGNCHAHLMVTTRELTEDGESFAPKKSETVEEFYQTRWAQHAIHHQNKIFKEKGYSLRVDPLAPIGQEHIGNDRIRGRAFDFWEQYQRREELNREIASNPRKILELLIQRQGVFSKEDFERFVDKHTPVEEIAQLKTAFWKQEAIIPLLDKNTKKTTQIFTTMEVIQEEKKIVRFCERLAEKTISPIRNKKILEIHRDPLTEEQEKAFDSIVSGKGLSLVQGLAGTGKSYLLKAVSDAFEDQFDNHSIVGGKRVRALGPDNATAKALREAGIKDTENLYRFLFAAKHGQRAIQKGDVFIVDEAGKLGNKPLLEFLKIAEKNGGKVILCGDPNQLSPIERGSMFRHLCSKFSSSVLEEVQRHKLEEDRLMNRELARGEIGYALDRLNESKRMHWSDTRKEAMENLMKKWSYDNKPIEGKTTSFEGDLILSASKKEVVVFNQLARNIRKLRGELGEQEFSCRSVHGDIFVSQNDWLEFRKNDREMGVLNGDRGVLVEASPQSFTVAVQEGEKKTKLVTFDPGEFHSFQLGYATTVFRSQGKTVERTYMMHSNAQNRGMAYVGLTRHRWDVFYFVSRDEVKDLSHLKWLARRDFEKLSTQDFTTYQEIAQDRKVVNRKLEIQKLLESEELKIKMKGYGKKVWDSLKSNVSTSIEKHGDRREDKGFFKVPEERQEKAPVKLVSEKESGIDPEDFAKQIFKIDQKKNLYDNLPEEVRHAINQYRDDFLNTWKLKKELEKGETPAEENQEYKELEVRRNKAAFHVRENLAELDLSAVLGKKQAFFVEKHAKNYEEAFEIEPSEKKQQEGKEKAVKDSSTIEQGIEEKKPKTQKHERPLRPQENLSTQLSQNIEPLLYKLFPEGPSSKSQGGWRFGSKGSLAVKADGRFFDHERQEGGGPFKLIQRELNLDAKEAKEWARDFLGLSSGIEISRPFQKKDKTLTKEESHWVSLKPPANAPAPGSRQVGDYVETARYAYKNEKGELLHYVLRLEDKEGHKITPPLSYGYDSQKNDKPYWKMKGFDFGEEKKTLYHLEELEKKPLVPVLVVEGEKTADVGAAKLGRLHEKEYIAVTWHGGCQAASKTDWTPLAGRDVLIWPDNDKGGFQAAKEVERELLRVGSGEVKTVDHEWLQEKFEEKWDLADLWPKGLLRDEAWEKARGIKRSEIRDVFLFEIKKDEKPFAEKQTLSDIANAYEKGHREEIDTLLRLNPLKQEIVLEREGWEVAKLFKKEEQTFKQLGEDPSINASGELQKQLARQYTLFEAKHQKEPNLSEILVMKETIDETAKYFAAFQEQGITKGTLECAKQRSLEKLCEESLQRGQFEPKEAQDLHEDLMREAKEMKTAQEQQKEITRSLEKQQQLEEQMDRGPSLGL